MPGLKAQILMHQPFLLSIQSISYNKHGIHNHIVDATLMESQPTSTTTNNKTWINCSVCDATQELILTTTI
uniref:Uncharacterized protein n=1 Tax=Arundo donax TaxID=35708 RepID=A0A0A9GTE3_ARUDO